MSKNFEKVKRYYDLGLWDIEKVRAAVGKWITEACGGISRSVCGIK